MRFLRTKGIQILSTDGRPIFLKGINIGGWLMMEGYILHSLNLPIKKFKTDFKNLLNSKDLYSFEKSFRDHFIRESDIKRIAGHGFNCLRVPFHYRIIESRPYRHDGRGVIYLDKVIEWAKRFGIWIILDLHAAPGAQNCDWHSGSLGRAELWLKESFRERTTQVWEFLADRYKDCDTIAGFDLLNEAVLGNTKLLNSFYRKLIKRIRAIDRNHMFIIEGNNWAMDAACLDEFQDDNYMISIHAYQPLDFTFNFVPNLTYPSQRGWDKKTLRKYLEKYFILSKKRKAPIFVGEFGVNNRSGISGEDRWLKDMLFCFREFGFHWTYWTYKAVKNSIFPDGLYSYLENPPWVNRQGPHMGLATYGHCWRKHKKEMIRSWHTENFKCNQKIAKVLGDGTG